MTSLAAATSLMLRAEPVFHLVSTYFGSRGHLQNPNEWRAAGRWVTAGSGISDLALLVCFSRHPSASCHHGENSRFRSVFALPRVQNLLFESLQTTQETVFSLLWLRTSRLST